MAKSKGWMICKYVKCECGKKLRWDEAQTYFNCPKCKREIPSWVKGSIGINLDAETRESDIRLIK